MVFGSRSARDGKSTERAGEYGLAASAEQLSMQFKGHDDGSSLYVGWVCRLENEKCHMCSAVPSE